MTHQCTAIAVLRISRTSIFCLVCEVWFALINQVYNTQSYKPGPYHQAKVSCTFRFWPNHKREIPYSPHFLSWLGLILCIYPSRDLDHFFQTYKPIQVHAANCCVTISHIRSAAQQLLFHSRDYVVCWFLNPIKKHQCYSAMFTHMSHGLLLKPCQEPAPELHDLDIVTWLPCCQIRINMLCQEYKWYIR